MALHHQLVLPLCCLPVMDGGAGVSAVLDIDHGDGERQEAHAHPEAHPVHSLVAHKDLTVDIRLETRDGGTRAVFAKPRNLRHVTGINI